MRPPVPSPAPPRVGASGHRRGARRSGHLRSSARGSRGVRRTGAQGRRAGPKRPGDDVRRDRRPGGPWRAETGRAGDGQLRGTGALVARRTRGRVAAAQPRGRGACGLPRRGDAAASERPGRHAAGLLAALIPRVGGPCLGRAVDTTYRLVRPRTGAVGGPALDDSQQAVRAHPGGPLLVLAGPGTGKTTTLVEAIVDRIENRGASPDSVLALTFSRKAAEQLRDRVTARLGRTMATTLSSTFHSFAYGLVRSYSPADLYTGPLRLLSAPEQDVVLQELVSERAESVTWPESLRRATGTRGFAHEVQAVLARAQERGLGHAGLRRLGLESGRADLVAAAAFMEEYLDVLDSDNLIDYPGLIAEAVGLVTSTDRPEVRTDLRRRFEHIFVDEYKDSDPSQVVLLQALAGDGRNLTVVGDPDQSIYAFRGAEVRGILDFPHQFRTAGGMPADVVALRTTRRFGSRLLTASRCIASSISTRGAVDRDVFDAFRSPTPADNEYGHGRVAVRTFDTPRAETEHIAGLVRRAPLEDGVPWSEIAVLVRSGRTSIPGLRRSLGAAGVPVEVASDDTPLVREPAVLPLLDALRAALNLDNDDRDHPDYVGLDRADALLLSPLAGLDATEVRGLARALRRREMRAAAAEDRSPDTSADLLRDALLRPGALDDVHGRAAAKVSGLG